MSCILVTGAAGYIGSHTCVELMAEGFDVVALDDLSNSHLEALMRVEAITGRKFVKISISDVRDRDGLRRLFETHRISAVIHFAAKKAVGESVQFPLSYYDNNLQGVIALAEIMTEYEVTHFVFSSSATVYGVPERLPYQEDFPTRPINPYGRTKLMGEEILRDVAAANSRWRVCLLRYFNPVGAHPSGMIGENPEGIPNNLMPYVCQVAIGRLKELKIFGNDYPTADGTGVRDYIHVVDLAKGHVAALKKLAQLDSVTTINLGTGRGFSVLELVQAFSKACGKDIPHVFAERREGDLAAYWADPQLAKTLLGWEAQLSLERMCEDAWRWQSANPGGYRQESDG